MEVEPLDVTWSKSLRVHRCTALTAETVHDRPGSKSCNLTTTRNEARKTAKKPTPNWTDTYLISVCLTRPLEPILLPKLPIQLAEFTNLHCSVARGCSPWRPAGDMSTACHENYATLLGFSRADKSVPDTT
ncbi:unnamed protein product [Schistosoma mattheei]|uniref:Uncharacterized protein n=1 Tax=Schistosoma mattheei TaxID=31246 RepID=A0A183NVM6_9TREM|nr:unnamed protein product [Schistosoma mattheei]